MTTKVMEYTKSAASTMHRAPAAAAPAMVSSLCEAFADDPGLSWIWPDREDRLRRLPFFFKPIVTGTMASGIAFHSTDSAAVSL